MKRVMLVEFGAPMRRPDGELNVLTCKDCKHWNPKPRYEGEPFGACERIGSDSGHVQTEGMAFIDAMSGCDGLRTAADFGCVLWEGKP